MGLLVNFVPPLSLSSLSHFLSLSLPLSLPLPLSPFLLYPSLFHPSTVDFNHFHILRAIGKGAFGKVSPEIAHLNYPGVCEFGTWWW